MIQKKYCHGSVGLGNKLFVISGYDNNSCEVNDSNSNVFTEIKELKPELLHFKTLPLVNVGYKILVFSTLGYNQKLDKAKTKVIFTYDVLKEQWSKEDNKQLSR